MVAMERRESVTPCGSIASSDWERDWAEEDAARMLDSERGVAGRTGTGVELGSGDALMVRMEEREGGVVGLREGWERMTVVLYSENVEEVRSRRG